MTAAVGDVVSQQYRSEYFQAIVMNNVIEHVPNPATVFSECSGSCGQVAAS